MKKLRLIIILASAITLLILACTPKMNDLYTKPDKSPNEITADDLLYWATLDGLTRDVFPRDLAIKMLEQEQDYFVAKCPICRNTERALRYYVKNAPKTKKTNTSKETLAMLQAEDKTTRQEGLKVLIGGYVKAEYQLLDLDKANIARIEASLEENREQGMALKREDFGTFCPSCDGACQKP